jgi:serine/threonine protein kinase
MAMNQEISVGGGKYLLGKKLGGGSFGEIYLGVNKLSKEFVAVKLVQVATIGRRSQRRLANTRNWRKSTES